jgi:hypothetical protein
MEPEKNFFGFNYNYLSSRPSQRSEISGHQTPKVELQPLSKP